MKRFEMQFPPGVVVNNVCQVITNSTAAVNQKEAGVLSNLQVTYRTTNAGANNG